MSKEFIYNLRFTIPGSLIMWSMFIWLMLAIFDPR